MSNAKDYELDGFLKVLEHDRDFVLKMIPKMEENLENQKKELNKARLRLAIYEMNIKGIKKILKNKSKEE